MEILEILENPGVGNLLLLFAAIIGVLGSYLLYRIRLRDRKEATPRALKAEIEANSLLDTWIRDRLKQDNTPAQIIQSTAAYEQNIENIGLLSDEEVEILSDFYSKAISVNDAIEWTRETDIKFALEHNQFDKGKQKRVEIINSEIDRLAVTRWKAVQILNKNLGEDYKPLDYMELPTSEGDVVSEYHPAIAEVLLEKGIVEKVEDDSNLVRCTEKGEEFFSNVDGYEDRYDYDHELSFS